MTFDESLRTSVTHAYLEVIANQLVLQNKITVLSERLKLGLISQATYEEQLKELGF